MTISTSDLQAERELLVKDFEALSDRIKKVEVDVLKTNEIDREIVVKLQKRIEELEEKTYLI